MKELHIFIIVCFAFFSGVFFSSSAHADYDKSYYRQVVRTLIDSEKLNSSNGNTLVASAEVEKHLAQESMQWKTFARPYGAANTSGSGVLSVTVGKKALGAPSRGWWKKLSSQKNNAIADLWLRPVNIKSTKFFEILARKKVNEVLLEMRLLANDRQSGEREILKRFRFFLSNAKKNSIFHPDKVRNVQTAKVAKKTSVVKVTKETRVAKITGARVDGDWVGPMQNSKGSKADTSILKLKSKGNGQITGTWHAGWSIQNAQRKGNTITWEHKNLFNGCRDYENQLQIQKDGKTAKLNYKVHDRCTSPHRYTGSAELALQ